jgi:hypothetical protein
MVSLDLSPERVVERRYAESSGDPTFAELLALRPAANEDDLADLIELDGRKRLAMSRPVELHRYLDAVPDLVDHPVALDAAIDVTLRSLSGGRRPNADAVRTLGLNYPRLERAIRDAAMLGRSMLSTTEVHRSLTADLPGPLPVDFGPALPDGRTRYQLQELLGSGACGAVYRAVDRQLSEDDRPALVAIKLMRFRDTSPWARQRFIEEATKARRITHPHVARVLDRGVADGDADFIVYEFVEGGDLQAWCEGQPGAVTARQAAQLVAKAARAVHAAHAAGLVHCDLKPGNILLTHAGEPKVTDFGIAVRAGAGPNPALPAEADRPRGNMAFISPEQFRMEDGALTAPSDVYALGGILFFLLTGQYPNGQSLDEVQTMHDPSHGRSTPPSVRSLRREVDRDLDAICRRAMAPAPAGRHASAAELAMDLESWLGGQPILWTRPGIRHRARLWAGRRPWTAGLTVALIASLLAGATMAGRFWAIAVATGNDARRAADQAAATRGEFEQLYGVLKVMGSDRIVQELLPTVMVLEWLNGATVLDDESRNMLWTDRIRLVSDLVAQAEQAGRGGTLETMMWRHALAFWLVSDGQFENAGAMIDADMPRWSSMLASDDPWLVQFRALAACVQVQRWQALGVHVETGPESPAIAARDSLVAAHKVLDGAAAGTPMHQLVLRHLIVLWGEDLLDEPRLRGKVEERLEAVSG